MVKNYYADDPGDPDADGEDAFDMRKPLSRDKDLRHARTDGEKWEVQPEDVW